MGAVAYTWLVSFLLWRVSKGEGAGSWGYHPGMGFSSPDHWKDVHDWSCGGPRQSPININKRSVIYSSSLSPISISQGESKDNVSLKTSATSLYLKFTEVWNMSSGSETCLRPVAIHWHWGSVDTQGSEHTIDNKKFPLEGHIVTYNCRLFTNFSSAAASENGLYVFGLLYQVGEANPALEKVLSSISSVVANGNVTIQEISPFSFLPRNLSTYYQYNGSLTTPPCTENVLWTVFEEMQAVSTAQLNQFRLLQYGQPEKGPMVDNFRPVQLDATNKRVVYSSFNLFNEGSTSTCSSTLISFLIVATISLFHRSF